MNHDSKEANNLVIKDTPEDFETWINKDFISPELRVQLRKSDILLIPTEGFRDLTYPVFPVKTEELFNYLRKNSPEDINIDICIEDKDYREVALHSDLVILSSFIVSSVALPILINLISTYLSQKLLKPEKTNVKVSITVVNKDGESKNLSYEGSVDHFKEVANKSKDLWEG